LVDEMEVAFEPRHCIVEDQRPPGCRRTSVSRGLALRRMPVDEAYRTQASLLVKVVPFVASETAFALKGGTAINLFLRDMPRLSVDLDLAWLPSRIAHLRSRKSML